MATIKEIVYDIKNIVRGGLQSDDEIISLLEPSLSQEDNKRPEEEDTEVQLHI